VLQPSISSHIISNNLAEYVLHFGISYLSTQSRDNFTNSFGLSWNSSCSD